MPFRKPSDGLSIRFESTHPFWAWYSYLVQDIQAFLLWFMIARNNVCKSDCATWSSTLSLAAQRRVFYLLNSSRYRYQEKFYFNPGDTGFMTFDTSFGKIGVAICWDQWFPEAARSMALQGAEVSSCLVAFFFAASICKVFHRLHLA